jgi:hypothetical protein
MVSILGSGSNEKRKMRVFRGRVWEEERYLNKINENQVRFGRKVFSVNGEVLLLCLGKAVKQTHQVGKYDRSE